MRSKLRETARMLKRSRTNTKFMIVELMKISSIDFTVDHAGRKLVQYGFPTKTRCIFKYMMELCDEHKLIFNGKRPEYVHGERVGALPVFGLIVPVIN